MKMHDDEILPRIQVPNLNAWAEALRNHHRPLLTHLNADTSWLLQLPHPSSASPPPGRTHFNILLDPWLQGPQSDVASWFSTQWHIIPPSVATIADLNACLSHLESRGATTGSLVDVVAISHEFTDHCHRATLEELPKTTPVFATDVAAALIRSWGHFDTVITTPALGSGVNWSKLTVGSLPDWLAIGKVTTPGNALYYHSALIVAFDLEPPCTSDVQNHITCEAIIYSPHGIDSSALSPLRSSNIETLALLHGLHDVSIWMTKQLNLGALNGIQAVRDSGARYWVATHDEIKKGGGFIAPLLRRIQYTLKEAVAHEQLKIYPAPEYQFLDLGSGDGVVLK